MLLLALIAAALAPGTWIRTPIINGFDRPITLEKVEEPGEAPPPGWALEGVWEYDGEGRFFGGFSAMIALGPDKLRAFSDRGARFTLVEPDRPQRDYLIGQSARRPRSLTYQVVGEAYGLLLWDIESATRNPQTGQYWLGYEYIHAIHRFAVTSEVDGVRVIQDEVDWSDNSGAEAMVRLRDGRFVVIREIGSEALVYPDDPITGAEPQSWTYVSPLSGFAVTDAKELPDGRLLLLLRAVAWDVPPFEARLAIADIQARGEARGTVPQIAPKLALDLTAVAPRENYEGLAVRARKDGALDIWVISDDNFSILQRTLLVKLRLDPSALAGAPDTALDTTPDTALDSGASAPADPPPETATQKAREEPRAPF
ncbi:MAG: esterase-like activity of phytase family protein [Pseudomonadota bacterium]